MREDFNGQSEFSIHSQAFPRIYPLSARHATTFALPLTVSPKEEGLVREGLDSIASEGRLGAVLVQFPVSFKNADDTRDYLFSVVRKFNQYPLVLGDPARELE